MHTALRVCLIGLGLTLGCLLAGCGAGRDAVPDTVPAPTRGPLPAVTATPASPSPTSQIPADDILTLVFWSDPGRAPAVAELGKAFATAYGVKVVVEVKELSVVLDDLRAALQRREGMPDLFIGGHDWIPLLAVNGILMPMDLEAFADRYAPSVLAAMSHEGLYYGVPVAADNLALVYNPELLARSPETWSELRQFAQQQVDAGTADVGLAINALSPFDVYPVLTGFAGDLFRHQPSSGFDLMSITIDSTAAQQAMAWLQDMNGQGLMDVSRPWHEMHRLFQAGRLPMMVTGPWSLPLLDQGSATYDIASFPEGGRSFVNVQGYMINAYAQDPFLSWLFLAHMVLTEDAMLRLYEAHPASPPAFLPTVSQIDNPHHRAFAELAVQGVAVPNIPEMNEIWKIWGQAQYAIMVDGADPAAALGGARTAIASVLQARIATTE